MAKKKVLKKNQPPTKEHQGIFSWGEDDHTGRRQGLVKTATSKLLIPAKQCGTALAGDEVRISSDKTGAWQLKIIKRRREFFVGQYHQEPGQDLFISADPKWPSVFTLLLDPKTKRPRASDKILVKWHSWKNPLSRPVVKLIKIIGPAGQLRTETNAICLYHQLPEDFSPAARAEAKKIKTIYPSLLNQAASQRRDFRHHFTLTIDPTKAKDFDDALSLKQIAPDRWELGVHIADVSYLVKPQQVIDEEASQRANSVYLGDTVIPMLPSILADDLCSLRPQEDRLTYSAVFTLNQQANIVDQWFGRTIVRSDQRLDYDQAQELIDQADTTGPDSQALKQLASLAEQLVLAKHRRGALSLIDREVEMELATDGLPLSLARPTNIKFSHQLIESFMLLANHQVAEAVFHLTHGRERMFIYRNHDRPELGKLDELKNMLHQLPVGKKFSWSKNLNHDLNNLLAQVVGHDEEQLINRLIIRTMSKAEYSFKNIGHFGLALPCYTHFTSPIRRYADIIAHRLLSSYQHQQIIKTEERERYQRLAEHASSQERLAQEAERDFLKLKQAEYFQQLIGQHRKMVISGVIKTGLFVEDLATGAEGMIRLNQLTDDHYAFDLKTLSLVGKNHGHRFRLGDTLQAKVLASQPSKKQIDFSLVDD